MFSTSMCLGLVGQQDGHHGVCIRNNLHLPQFIQLPVLCTSYHQCSVPMNNNFSFLCIWLQKPCTRLVLNMALILGATVLTQKPHRFMAIVLSFLKSHSKLCLLVDLGWTHYRHRSCSIPKSSVLGSLLLPKGHITWHAPKSNCHDTLIYSDCSHRLSPLTQTDCQVYIKAQMAENFMRLS